MAMTNPPSIPDVGAHRIKRKAPPNISELERSEIEQLGVEQYPAPDPIDPFVVSPSENYLHPSVHENDSSWYPVPIPPGLAFGTPDTYTSENDIVTPLKPLPQSKSQQEGHYKRRVQRIASNSLPLPHLSTSGVQATGAPLPGSDSPDSIRSTPSLIRDTSSSEDSGTDETDSFPTTPTTPPFPTTPTSPNTRSRGRFSQFLVIKKSNPDVRPRTASPGRKVRQSLTSAQLPEIVPSASGRRLTPSSSRGTLNERQSPETMAPSLVPLPVRDATHDSLRSGVSSSSDCDHGCNSRPGTPRSILRPPPPPPPTILVTNSPSENAQIPPVPATPIPISLDAHAHYAYVSFPSLLPPASRSSENMAATQRTVSSSSACPVRQGPRRPSTAPEGTLRRSGQQTQTTPIPATEPRGEWTMPTPSQLEKAATLPIIAESGLRVAFGSLFANQRTIIIFIRHFWCPYCQDYMTALTELAPPFLLPSSSKKNRANNDKPAQLVVIGNGAYTLITKYRRIFGMKFGVYTDPTLGVYNALGMEMMNDEKHLRSVHGNDKAHGDGKKVKEGSYIKHGLMSGIAMVVMRALKVGMPVWEKGGDIGQLGGEFVLGPGLTCSLAHRMQNPKDHMPIQDVLKAAEVPVSPPPMPLASLNRDLPEHTVDLDAGRSAKTKGKAKANASRENANRLRKSTSRIWKPEIRRSKDTGRAPDMESTQDEELWMQERQRNLELLKERKKIRRQSLVSGDSATVRNQTIGRGFTSQSQCEIGEN